jgi:hypothetical protein
MFKVFLFNQIDEKKENFELFFSLISGRNILNLLLYF